MSHLVTQTGPIAHSPGWPPARPAPGPHARGRGSSSGSGVEPASGPGSPPCSPCGRGRRNSTAGAAHCAGPGGTTAGSSDTCVVFASSSAGILQPPMMRTSTPERDLGRRRAEENEETFVRSFLKKTPSKKTGNSDRWNQYTFRSVLASVPRPWMPKWSAPSFVSFFTINSMGRWRGSPSGLSRKKFSSVDVGML